MDYLELPRLREVRGRVAAPPSKSSTNRALLLAGLSPVAVEVVSPLPSSDTDALLSCLAALGARVESTTRGLSVSGPLRGAARGWTELDAGESGTAARLLVAVACALPGRFRVDGAPRLRERPMAELIDALRAAGARLRSVGDGGFLPVEVEGRTLRGGTVTVDASRSSQFLSALLIAGLEVRGGMTVRPAGALVSAPYIEATVEALRGFGHAVRREGSAITVRRGSESPRVYAIPGDYSSAVPLLAAAGAVGGRVTVTGLGAAEAAADSRALPVLQSMGIAIGSEGDAITASFPGGSLAPVTVEGTEFPDSVPALAALAALASGESRFTGIAHLRHKESDRISSTEALIRAAGGIARAGPSELAVSGGLDAGGAVTLPTFQDHRIAMAAALLAIARGGCRIENPGCVAKSYPAFFRDLASLAP